MQHTTTTPLPATTTYPPHLRPAHDQCGTLRAISVFLSLPDFARHDFRVEAWERAKDIAFAHRRAEVAR